MGCSSSCSRASSPITVERVGRVQCDSKVERHLRKQGNCCNSFAPINSAGSCGSTVSTNASAALSLGAASSLRSSQYGGRLSTTLSSSSGEGRLPQIPDRKAAHAAAAQACQQQGNKDTYDKHKFRSASQSRPVPWLDPVSDSTLMQRRRTKSKERQEPATPSTSAGETVRTTWSGRSNRSGDKGFELQIGECQPSHAATSSRATSFAGDF